MADQSKVVCPGDRRGAAQLSTLLRAREGGREVSVVTSAGEQVALTPALLDLLAQAAGIMADGADVAVFAHEALLTSQQAADLLNVSRQYMVRLLERGDLPSTKVGTHRRVRAADLERYRRRRDRGRRTALAAMADRAQADGGYDAPAAFGPRRGAGQPKGA